MSEPTTSHRHHWRISPPDGSTSEAYCLTCPETKTFKNSLDQGTNSDYWREGWKLRSSEDHGRYDFGELYGRLSG